jgi:hypothetical protein
MARIIEYVRLTLESNTPIVPATRTATLRVKVEDRPVLVYQRIFDVDDVETMFDRFIDEAKSELKAHLKQD